jgi:hypothetical protein
MCSPRGGAWSECIKPRATQREAGCDRKRLATLEPLFPTCCVPGTAKVDYLLDNLGATQGRLPDAATRRRMEEFIDRL